MSWYIRHKDKNLIFRYLGEEVLGGEKCIVCHGLTDSRTFQFPTEEDALGFLNEKISNGTFYYEVVKI